MLKTNLNYNLDLAFVLVILFCSNTLRVVLVAQLNHNIIQWKIGDSWNIVNFNLAEKGTYRRGVKKGINYCW